ncbi:MAG TPA: hypothetical protein VF980_15820 [Thermoanaerobaculia bacterium]
MKILSVPVRLLLLSYAITLSTAAGRSFDDRPWIVGYDAADGRQHVTEYVLRNETVEHYTELVTHQVILDVHHEISMADLLGAIRKGFGPDCRNFAWTILSQDAAHATYRWSHSGCDGYSSQAEIARLSLTKEGISRWAYTSMVLPLNEEKRALWKDVLETLPGVVPDHAVLRRLSISGGRFAIRAFVEDVPIPAEGELATVLDAGPAFIRDGDHVRLKWIAHLAPNSPAAFSNVKRVKLEDVSGKEAVVLAESEFRRPTTEATIEGTAHAVTPQNYPWLYSSEATILVLRITLYQSTGSPEVLIQPVLIGAVVKRKLRSAGYLQ